MKAPLQKSRIPENKAFVIREMNDPYFDKQWHAHPEYQLVAILRGSGTRYIGDHIKPFKGGDTVLTGPGLPHVWRSDNAYFDPENGLDIHGIVIYFPDNFLGAGSLQKEEFEEITNLLIHAARGLEITGKTNEKVTKMMKEMVSMKRIPSIIMLLHILQVLAESTELVPITQVNYSYNHPTTEKDKMGDILDFILKNFKEKITLHEVASLANMSESAFSRYFKSRVNKSFSDFLGDVRISNARKLLQDEDLNISQVCFESGFPTLSNFNKQFKDRLGKTPLNYKKEFNEHF
ncbi:AraC-like DNA-binding protein [Algoriphagus ratkowskyi]|uniref:AraC family transcriptional regulator n=1 Tax=Algoriphagus ratkowskyi TaxID=57028 RepID=A0A2W7RN60_9BACT|nr:AraC family transcriptional regulator [Algoriphagus ratkowskyi]PZX56957.1 AraC-like DNA-binding protein [Algoriphagus ratkowskyi]TXD79868.1 AraC family transcriptional regulator [Algoriphagus ratkowskyi]